MHVAIFTDTYHPQINGVVTSIDLFTEELRKRGHEVHIFCPADKRLRRDKYIHPINSFEFKPYPEYRVGLPFPLKIYLQLKKIDPEILHLQSPASIGALGLYLGGIMNIPVIASYHTILGEYLEYLPGNRILRFRKLNKKIVDKYIQFFYNHSDKIIVPGEQTKKILLDNDVIKSIEVIPTGIRTGKYWKTKNLGSRIKILHVGRLCKERSVDEIIEAFKKLNGTLDCELIIVSKGPAEKELKNLVKKLKIESRVNFTGYINEEEKIRLYNTSDLFVTASTTDTQGLVALEAMATGIPVIAANAVGAIDYIQNDYNGLLFEPHNIDDLADKMLSVLSSPELKEKLVENGFKTAKELDIEKCVERLEAVYRETLANHKQSLKERYRWFSKKRIRGF
jgi:1,2-diacylglycerol 3-alpha-glucosyltransferase